MFSKTAVALAPLFLLSGILYFGFIKPSYSHLKHTISELGEVGYTKSRWVSLGFFLPLGLILMVVALSSFHQVVVQGLAASLATGYIIAAFFPCDDGSPFSGTWRQQIHNLGGFVEYAGGTICLFLASEDGFQFYFLEYKTVGMIVIVCTIIISIPGVAIRGLVQRIAEFLLFASLVNLVWQ
ncbi:MAG: DUF998 domain-containing protein [Cyclobacteriaceae bacterium]